MNERCLTASVWRFKPSNCSLETVDRSTSRDSILKCSEEIRAHEDIWQQLGTPYNSIQSIRQNEVGITYGYDLVWIFGNHTVCFEANAHVLRLDAYKPIISNLKSLVFNVFASVKASTNESTICARDFAQSKKRGLSGSCRRLACMHASSSTPLQLLKVSYSHRCMGAVAEPAAYVQAFPFPRVSSLQTFCFPSGRILSELSPSLHTSHPRSTPLPRWRLSLPPSPVLRMWRRMPM